ncbi:hypothetical protein [Modestobacter sp. DSM 44400]|uniref:hypothetical protein n=1 Tax=Modestobacter sp. DSM 44400 TaxID=1550230 RepID=UPI000B824291|nr:hypothetical protein [Modestobacter sp. DSM 44400]
MTEQRPIGWWVKHLDQLLEEVVDHSLAAEGLTRRHWQALHALSSGVMDEPCLRDVLAPFGGPVDVGSVVADIEARGWVTRRRVAGSGTATRAAPRTSGCPARSRSCAARSPTASAPRTTSARWLPSSGWRPTSSAPSPSRRADHGHHP